MSTVSENGEEDKVEPDVVIEGVEVYWNEGPAKERKYLDRIFGFVDSGGHFGPEDIRLREPTVVAFAEGGAWLSVDVWVPEEYLRR